MHSPSDDPATAGAAGNGIARLLRAFAQGDPSQVLTMDGLLAGLGHSAFGMFLFVSILPGFIPIPGFGGAVSGPLVILIGLQLLVGLGQPWLPRFIGSRGPRRATMIRFCDRITPWLSRLEHLVRPRLQRLTGHRIASAFTGLLLVLLGVLLALPIPFTNYLFAGLLLLFALALLERDGALLLVLWLVAVATLVGMGLLSEQLTTMIAEWVQRLRAA